MSAFVLLTTGVVAGVLVAPTATSAPVLNADGGQVGRIGDQLLFPDGGATPIQPAPGQPTLEALAAVASRCVSVSGVHTVLFELVFHATGYLATRKELNGKASGCVLSAFAHARIAPFHGPDAKVFGYVLLN